MNTVKYAWFIGSLIFLLIWGVVYLLLRKKSSRKEMLQVSFWTSLLGLTEPIFVPEYWNPPSLFDLAQKIGFDIESLIFAFAIGGISAVIYELLAKSFIHVKMNVMQRQHSRHKFHLFALLSAPIIFSILYLVTDLNPIYSTTIALFMGGVFTLYCRFDLKKKMITSGFIFLILYYLFFIGFVKIYPTYVQEVWNMQDISGVLVSGVPLEELLFAFSLGFLWSGIYEHINWLKISSSK